MSENDKVQDVQDLLRLKQYEHPGDAHVDQVLEQFRERRDREKAVSSSQVGKSSMQEQVMVPFTHWIDKFTGWYSELGAVRWALPMGTAAAAAVAFTSISNRDGIVQDVPASTQSENLVTTSKTINYPMPSIPNRLQSSPPSSSNIVPVKAMPRIDEANRE